jgi:MFS family permease
MRPGNPAPTTGPGTRSTASDWALTAKSTSPNPGNVAEKPGGVRSCKFPFSSKLVTPAGKFPGGVVGCALGAWSSDAVGRRPSIIAASIFTIGLGYLYARSNAASDPTTVLLVGFFLVVAIYVQTAMLFGVYTPELFPTEIRLRANGICNTLGRAATVVSPFVVGFLMVHYGLPGVIWLMIGLLVVQIIVVGFWGVEPRARALEDVAAAKT